MASVAGEGAESATNIDKAAHGLSFNLKMLSLKMTCWPVLAQRTPFATYRGVMAMLS